MDAHLKTLIDELVVLSEKATPGKWEWRGNTIYPVREVSDVNSDAFREATTPIVSAHIYHNAFGHAAVLSMLEANSNFIIALRNAFPAIVSALSERDRVRAALSDGELWSFFRRLIDQGTAIQQDYAAGKYPSYEHFSARMDAAARERVDDFKAIFSLIATPAEEDELPSAHSLQKDDYPRY